jgi:hypothetical protein
MNITYPYELNRSYILTAERGAVALLNMFDPQNLTDDSSKSAPFGVGVSICFQSVSASHKRVTRS